MDNDLRLLREERRWTQAALADQLGVSRQTINALETGRYDPSLPLAFRLARLFDTTIESMFHPDHVAVANPSGRRRTDPEREPPPG
jgi:putative transcriptional regulator